MSDLCSHVSCDKTATETAGFAVDEGAFAVPVCDEHYETIIRGDTL